MRPFHYGGAHVEGSGTRFRAFTTSARGCAVRLFDAAGRELATEPMERRSDGVFERVVHGVGHGALYSFVLDGRVLPDPYARFLPQGVHGPAMVVEPRHVFRHTAPVRGLAEQVIYELHVGTFSEQGGYEGVIARLPDLAALGVTTLELMPVASFAGQRGWGYDGVALFAPFAPYGTPDELCALVDAAHAQGLSVMLDVVYNHFGPDGNYLSAYCPEYFRSDQSNVWGPAPDFTHPAMRAYVLDNARTWLEDFRFDGLRLDAVHAIVDGSPRHVLRELSEQFPGKILVAEDDRNDPAVVEKLGLGAVWADDFHHQVRVTLTGEKDGYYGAYTGGVEALARTIERGWFFEGQVYDPSGKARGKPAPGLPPWAFVYCIQNHDQIGNRALGERLTAQVSIDAYCMVSALLLFLPATPLLFMGQEWAATTPFLFFTDHEPELGAKVSKGRREEFKHFRAFSDPAERDRIPDPQALDTFLRSRLSWSERNRPAQRRVLALYRELLALRRDDAVLRGSAHERPETYVRGEVLCVRRRAASGERLLLANFGKREESLAELAPGAWQPLFSTRPGESPGTLAAEQAVVLGRPGSAGT
jgi:maltooligosyltrehalose trehalohydrolase